jgi:hypothetical protein
MKKIFFSFGFSLLLMSNYGQTIVPAGPVSGIWTKAHSPYYISDNISIPEGQILTVEPGVHVIALGYFGIHVQGQLIAEGNIKDSIYFTRNDTTGLFLANTTMGGWAGIWFYNSSMQNEKSKIKFCNFNFGKGLLGSTLFASDSIENTNRYGGAIFIKNYSNIDITNNKFQNNNADYAGAIFCENSAVLIGANVFKSNYSDLGSCIILDSCKSHLVNNIFYDNISNKGLIILNTDSSRIINNTIVYNKSKHSKYIPGDALAINASKSKSIIQNNIIAYNKRPLKNPTFDYFNNTWNTDSAYVGKIFNLYFNGEPGDSATIEAPFLKDVMYFKQGEGKYTLNLKYNYDWSGTTIDTFKIKISSRLDTVNFAKSLGAWRKLTSLTEYSLEYNDDSLSKTYNTCCFFFDSMPDYNYNCVYNDDKTIYAITHHGITNYIYIDPQLKFLTSDPEIINTANFNFYLSETSPCINSGNPSSFYNDSIIPPGKSSERNDIGAFGGHYNYLWCIKPLLETKFYDTNVCEQNSIDLQVSAYGNSPFSYKWELNNTETGNTENSLSILNSKLINSGVYKCVVSNACGSDSVSIDLTVNRIDTVNFFSTTCDPGLVGTDTTILLNHNGCDSVVIKTTSLLPSEIVNLNESVCEGNKIRIGELEFSETGNYQVKLTNKYGCDSIVNLALTVYQNPIVSLGNDTTISTEDTIILDAGEGFETYNWNTGETTQTLLINSLNGIGDYTFFVVVSTNNCSGSDTILISIESATNTIENSEAVTKIKVYPNPSSGKINIKLENVQEKTHIVIISETGQIVYSKQYKPAENNIVEQIDLTAYPDGNYFIKVLSKHETKTEKFIFIK